MIKRYRLPSLSKGVIILNIKKAIKTILRIGKSAMNKLMKAFNSATEIFRSANEYALLKSNADVIKKNTPHGDGHPVLVLPGFLTNDTYTSPLREFLKDKGYKVYTSNDGMNLGLSDKTAENLSQRVEEIFKENGGRKMTIIGHSLGGVYARELAREYPDMVRAVVTLGTPFSMQTDATSPALQRLYSFFNVGTDHLGNEQLARRGLTPPPQPTTSIFSKQDGIVDWEASINPKTSRSENIEVSSSHLGMLVNPLSMLAVLDRLAQPEGSFTPFDAAKYKGVLSSPYPENRLKDADLPKNPNWSDKDPDAKPLFRKKYGR
jgi:pimeloyl-ACP methyl ester carboxylesterase